MSGLSPVFRVGPRRLKLLNMSSGSESLARAIGGFRTLLHLDLGQNHFGPAGAAALASAIQHLGRLTLLDVRRQGDGETCCSVVDGWERVVFLNACGWRQPDGGLFEELP